MFLNKIKSRNREQKWCLVFVLVLLGFTINTNGEIQTDSTLSKAKIPKNAFQFQIAENFQLRSFQGSVISMKRLLSEKKALRFGLSVNTSINNDNSKYYANPDSQLSTRKLSNSSYGVNISAQYLYCPYKVSGIIFFIGAGPILSYSYMKSDDKNVYYQTFIADTVTAKQVETMKDYGIGIISVFGVEWFLKEKLSLTAEYGLSIQNKWHDVDRKINRESVQSINEEMKQTRNGTNFTIQPLAVKFGISIYF
jgi:hypothetical protein